MLKSLRSRTIRCRVYAMQLLSLECASDSLTNADIFITKFRVAMALPLVRCEQRLRVRGMP